MRRRQCVPRGSNHRPSPQNPVSRKPPYCRHCSSSVARAQAVLAPPSGHFGSQTVHTLHKSQHMQHSTHAPSCNEQVRRTCSTEGPACKLTYVCATRAAAPVPPSKDTTTRHSDTQPPTHCWWIPGWGKNSYATLGTGALYDAGHPQFLMSPRWFDPQHYVRSPDFLQGALGNLPALVFGFPPTLGDGHDSVSPLEARHEHLAEVQWYVQLPQNVLGLA